MTIEEFIKKTLEKGFTNIQITEKTGISSSVYLIDKEIDSYQDDYSKLYSIKAEYKKKTVKLATEFLAEEIIDLLLKKYAVIWIEAFIFSSSLRYGATLTSHFNETRWVLWQLYIHEPATKQAEKGEWQTPCEKHVRLSRAVLPVGKR